MLRWIVIIVAGFILYKMFTMDKKKKTQVANKEQDHKIKTGDMVKDPICGKYIPVDGDIRVRQGEELHRFCSYECRDKYLKSIGEPTPAEQAEAEWESEEK